MFDIGFSELIVVFVVALIILGPERLPIAAKTAGLWIRKIRRTINSVQREINAQLDQEELQRKIEQTNQRILKEGNEIQNAITPLPESTPLSEKESPVLEEASPSQASTIGEVGNSEKAPETVSATMHESTKEKSTETSRS